VNVNVAGSPSPGAEFDTIDILNGESSSSDLETEVLAWISLLQAVYTDDTSFYVAELWKYDPGTFDATFWSARTLTFSGDNVNPAIESGQAIFTFRSQEGGTMKVKLLESAISGQDPRATAELSEAEANLAAYVINPLLGQFFLARDTSYPFAFVRLFPGQDEATFKRRHRL
jgi:hypothetical protein